jgi:hypothetical protein
MLCDKILPIENLECGHNLTTTRAKKIVFSNFFGICGCCNKSQRQKMLHERQGLVLPWWRRTVLG